jgi:hypothetical protein
VAAGDPIRAQHDPALDVRIAGSRALVYADGADASLDRPAHVRAGSGLVIADGAAWVVQDDTLFLARIDLSRLDGGNSGRPLEVGSVTLPAEGGVRQFDEGRGNKKDKLDLECAVALAGGGILAIGSGSTAARRRMLEIRGGATRVIDGAAFYAVLEAAREFSGSELNLEGALVRDGGVLRLFQRGNGAPKDGLLPRNATADVSLADALAGRAPSLSRMNHYDLGMIDGVALSFTDAAADDLFRVHYLAAAEDSPDTYHDGENVGCVIGRIDETTGGARFGRVLEADGVPSRRKLEGLAWDPSRERWLAVEDRDDPTAPSELVWFPTPAG